jgi:hypothetical protein
MKDPHRQNLAAQITDLRSAYVLLNRIHQRGMDLASAHRTMDVVDVAQDLTHMSLRTASILELVIGLGQGYTDALSAYDAAPRAKK